MVAVVACDSGDDDDGAGGGAPMMTADGPIPAGDAAALRPWLEGRGYLEWEAESAVHESSGPHFGGVLTYANDALFDSLEAGEAEHPEGAASVKELYGDGNRVMGWAVAIKTQASSDAGNGWYWYELFDGSTFADGQGAGVCVGCHASGTDFFRAPFPLQ